MDSLDVRVGRVHDLMHFGIWACQSKSSLMFTRSTSTNTRWCRALISRTGTYGDLGFNRLLFSPIPTDWPQQRQLFSAPSGCDPDSFSGRPSVTATIVTM